MILTVDPDTTRSGYCVGSAGAYVRAGLASIDQAPRIVASVEPRLVAIEIPRIHPSDNPAKINDMIDVAMVGAEWRCLSRRYCGSARTYESSRWKGQVHKAHAHRHLLDVVLLPTERDALFADVKTAGIKLDVERYVKDACSDLARGKRPRYGSAMTEILDAVCIFAFECGRFRGGYR